MSDVKGSILVTPRSLTRAGLEHVPELDPLRNAGYQLVSCTPGVAPEEHELAALLPGAVGWLAGVEPISGSVLEQAPDLRVISRNGTGTDNVDLPAAERLGITVARAAGANAQGVAELALTLALTCVRAVPWSSTSVKAGHWERWQGRELADTAVGVVGLGAIGGRVARLFSAIGARVQGFDPYAPDSAFAVPTLEDAFRGADVITLHAPPPADGRPLVTDELLNLVEPGAVLINTARAALVDDEMIRSALESGRLGAYAVDAFDTEPPELTPLLGHPRVVATPHIGGYTAASVSRATADAVQNLLAALEDHGAEPSLVGKESR